MDWKSMLSYISGSVDEELLLRNEYLVAENRVLRNQLKARRLSQVFFPIADVDPHSLRRTLWLVLSSFPRPDGHPE